MLFPPAGQVLQTENVKYKGNFRDDDPRNCWRGEVRIEETRQSGPSRLCSTCGRNIRTGAMNSVLPRESFLHTWCIRARQRTRLKRENRLCWKGWTSRRRENFFSERPAQTKNNPGSAFLRGGGFLHSVIFFAASVMSVSIPPTLLTNSGVEFLAKVELKPLLVAHLPRHALTATIMS
jgi:hypothetical protein